jgi:hypothetical protein
VSIIGAEYSKQAPLGNGLYRAPASRHFGRIPGPETHFHLSLGIESPLRLYR